MEISFDKEYLRQLYEEGMTVDKKHRFQPHIIARYQLRIKVLEQVRGIEELLAINSLHYEVLKGDKAGISSSSRQSSFLFFQSLMQSLPILP